jgi:hypothetical protein
MKALSPMGFVVAALGLAVPQINAAGFTYHFDTVFQGAPVPGSPAPWVDATFQDIAIGTVLLTITAAGDLPGTYFINGNSQGGLFFNLNPSLDPTDLSFTTVAANGSFGDAVLTGVDAYNADGDGYYDINVRFSTHTFSAGSSISYQIVDIYNAFLSASDFMYISAVGGGQGPYYAAAHLQGGISTWVASTQVTPVPEPGAGALLATALGLMGAWHRRRQRTSRD